MAYKAMLVDDEIFDIEWLKTTIPWEDLGLDLVGTAHSGFSALKLLSEQTVHILLSDIRMPIMSGLEMAKKAKELQPGLKVIFISGYEDFQYAKQAIQLPASGYVLKPIQLDEVLQLLEETVRSLDEEMQRAQRSEQLDRAMPHVKHALLLQWLHGQYDGTDILEELHPFRSASYVAAIVELDDIQWKINQYPKQDHESIVEGAVSQMIEFLQPHAGLCIRQQHRVSVVLDGGEDETVYRTLDELIRLMRTSSPFTVTIGLGGTVDSLELLPQSYQAAEACLGYKLYLGKSRFIRPQDIQPIVVEGAVNVEEHLDDLFTCMLNYDLVGTDDQLENIFQYVLHSGTKLSAYNFTLHFIAKLDKHFQRLGEDLYEILAWDYKHLEVLFQFETMDDIKSWLRSRLFELSELLMRKMKKSNLRLVKDIDHYVNNHLHEKITLKDLSRELGFTPNYIGFLFREETGEHFSDFLTRKRLERACKLLADPAIKVYEVSDQVGYKNIIYFNRHFKEFYGITPTEYRRKG